VTSLITNAAHSSVSSLQEVTAPSAAHGGGGGGCAATLICRIAFTRKLDSTATASENKKIKKHFKYLTPVTTQELPSCVSSETPKTKLTTACVCVFVAARSDEASVVMTR